MNSRDAIERIKQIAGEEIYNQIATALAGTTVYFPEETRWHDKSERNERLREDFFSGQYEIANLAQKYELSISRVYKIVQNRE